MGRPIQGHDVAADARRVFERVRAGGVAIIHPDVAYAVIAYSADAVRRFYEAKNRSYSKPTGIVGAFVRTEITTWRKIAQLAGMKDEQ